jgi:hypothetical protein
MLSVLTVSQTQVSMIDPEYLDIVRDTCKWHAGTRNGGYVCNTRKGMLHLFIWRLAGREIPPGHTLDHANQDVLDNRLENLRLATPTQQAYNRGVQNNSSTGVTGVCHRMCRGVRYWTANISYQVGGKRKYKRIYCKNKEEAIVQREQLLREYAGAFAPGAYRKDGDPL